MTNSPVREQWTGLLNNGHGVVWQEGFQKSSQLGLGRVTIEVSCR